jgi:hypothetical protein
MKRRTAIRNIAIISAGAVLLPACKHQDKASIPLKNISLSGSQEEMLAELCESVIPKTNNFIGAKDLKAHEFVLTMVDDCTGPEDRKQFTDGMKEFENACKTKFNSSFVKCTPQQRKALLKDMETNKDEKDNAAKFYKTVKRYTVQSFTSSRQYMVDVKKYKMVPGPDFKGCVPA